MSFVISDSWSVFKVSFASVFLHRFLRVWAVASRNRKLLDFGRMWNKSVRRIWNLPYNVHCSTLLLLRQCLPVFEEFCCRFIKFVQKYVTHDSALIRFVAGYDVQYGRNYSCLVQNVLFCSGFRVPLIVWFVIIFPLTDLSTWSIWSLYLTN